MFWTGMDDISIAWLQSQSLNLNFEIYSRYLRDAQGGHLEFSIKRRFPALQGTRWTPSLVI